MNKKVCISLLFLLSLLWLNSCHKTISEIDYNPNVLSSKDYIRAEDAVFEIVNSFFKGIHDTTVINQGYGYIDACDVTYYADENSMTFGYGSVNRICQDGKFRRNKFFANFSGQIFVEGVTVNILTDSLLVDDLSIEANIEIRNTGTNIDGFPEYSLKVVSSLIMLADTTKINGVSITTDFIMVWTEGSTTPTIHEDDVFLISGSAAGISSNGYVFTISIQDPLENILDCWWISQGISQITVPVAEFPRGEIDYIADDGCFNEMNFYFNDNLFYDYIK
jgi:hypothetical protein